MTGEDALRAEVEAVWAAMPRDARYLDPPDGGCVPLHEQVRRMAADAARAEALAEALREARDMVEDWAGYASEYFQNKHDLAGDLAKLDAALQPTAAFNGPASVTPNPDARKPTC